MRVLSRVREAAAVAILASAGSACGPSTPQVPTAPTPTNVARVTVVGTPPLIGSSSQFTATATLGDGTSQLVSAAATWSTSNAAVATVNGGGVVTGVTSGPVEIRAVYGGVTGSLAITVTPPQLSRMTGTILDAATRSPLAGATISIQTRTVTRSGVSDPTGRYTISDLDDGPATVAVTAAGYSPSTTSLTISGDRNLDFQLTRSALCPTIGFDGLAGSTTLPATYVECGVTIAFVTSNWRAGFGRPAPGIVFTAPLDGTTFGEVVLTAPAGARFRFRSADVYSSVTPIPYVFTGISSGAAVFTIRGTQPNTFGNYATVTSSQSEPIDTLILRLTTVLQQGFSGTNPMGLDNIVFGQ